MYEGLAVIVPMLPLMSALLVLYLASFTYVQNKKERVNQLFALFCVTIAVWMFGSFMQFTIPSYDGSVFWGRFVYIGIVFMPSLVYHFALTLTKQIKNHSISIPVAYIISITFLIMSRFDVFVGGLYKYDWGVRIGAQFLHGVFLLVFAYYSANAFLKLIAYYRSVTSAEEKERVKYVLTAFGVLAFSVIDFLPAYGIDIRFPIFYLFGVVFVIIITTAVVKYNFLNTKVLTTQILSTLVIFVLTIRLFFAQSSTDILLDGLLLSVVALLNRLLIKSVKSEIKQKEKLHLTATRLKKTTEKLRIANKHLKKLDQAKTEFLSITSHQLRTPLSGIKGYVSMLVDGDFGKFSKDQSGILIRVKDEVERLIRLVQVFLDVSRIESGRLTITKQEFDMATLARNVVQELLPTASSKNISIRYKNDENEKFMVNADKDKLKDVLVNMVDNAIKYTPEGYVNVTLIEKPQSVICEVSDSGVGVKKEEIDRLFEKFSRGEGIEVVSSTGTGLGLFIVKKIIESHKGKVWATSKGKGKGSTFAFEIPKK